MLKFHTFRNLTEYIPSMTLLMFEILSHLSTAQSHQWRGDQRKRSQKANCEKWQFVVHATVYCKTIFKSSQYYVQSITHSDSIHRFLVQYNEVCLNLKYDNKIVVPLKFPTSGTTLSCSLEFDWKALTPPRHYATVAWRMESQASKAYDGGTYFSRGSATGSP